MNEKTGFVAFLVTLGLISMVGCDGGNSDFGLSSDKSTTDDTEIVDTTDTTDMLRKLLPDEPLPKVRATVLELFAGFWGTGSAPTSLLATAPDPRALDRVASKPRKPGRRQRR